MGFNNLAPQPPINELADRYGEVALDRSRAVAEKSRSHIDVPYGPNPWQTLDIYLPDDQAATNLPVLMFMHGGGWTNGYKEWCGFMAPPLVQHPAILISPEYRLMPEARYPEAILDVVAAVGWIYRHIAAYGGSPDRIFVGGHSAGAMLAALLALDHERLSDGGVDPAVIKAAFCVSGTYHRDGMTGQMGYYVPPGPMAVEARSPLALAHQAKCPFHFTWGGKERQRERSERTNMLLISAIRDAGQSVDWFFDPQADHFTTHLDTGRNDSHWVSVVRRWFDQLPNDLMGGPR
jgi:acetyl esterase/lipase